MCPTLHLKKPLLVKEPLIKQNIFHTFIWGDGKVNDRVQYWVITMAYVGVLRDLPSERIFFNLGDQHILVKNVKRLANN